MGDGGGSLNWKEYWSFEGELDVIILSWLIGKFFDLLGDWEM